MATRAFIKPSPDRQRWSARRKAAVVLAVANGDITFDQALKGCNLSAEEFAAWQRDYEVHGVHGLRVTRLQIYNERPRRQRNSKPSTACESATVEVRAFPDLRRF